MGNFIATRLHVYTSGAVIFAINHTENENEIYGEHNAAIHGTTGHGHTGAVGDGPKLNSLSLDLTANYPWTGTHSFAASTSFAGGISGSVAFDTNTLFVDSVNNKVLIGSLTSTSTSSFQVIKSTAGGTVSADINNTDNTNVASNAQFTILTGGISSGDPLLVLGVTSGATWYAGVDNSDSDKFKIGTGGAVGTNTALTIDTSLNATLAGTLASGAISATGTITASGTVQGTQIISTVATGTPPFVAASTTKVTNFNADLLDGFNSGNSSGNIPISNGTLCTNLNAQFLNGQTEATLSLSATQITSGTLPVSRGGTGVTTSTGGINLVLSQSPTFSGTVHFGNNTSINSTALEDIQISAGAGDLLLSAGNLSSINLTDGAGSGGFRPVTDNHLFLGNTGNRWKEVWAVNGVIQTSDKREKKCIKKSDLGLTFIKELIPVSYKWKKGSDKKTHYGLIAQNVETVLDGKDFSGLYKDLNGPMGLNYSEFISPMIKAIQELSQEVERLKREVHS